MKYLLTAVSVWALTTVAARAQTDVGGAMWYRRLFRQKEIHVPVRRASGTSKGALLPVDFSRSNEFFCKLGDGWIGKADEVSFEVTFPPSFPKDALVYFSAKDWDSLWYNFEGPKPVPGSTQLITVPMFGKDARKRWKPGRHARGWNPTSAHRVRELGIKFDSPAGKPLKWQGQVTLEAMSKQNPLLKRGGELRNVKVSAHSLALGEAFEASFETTLPFKDPFDTKEVSLKAEIIRPDGEAETVDCFYFEDFLFEKSDMFGPLTPSGFPQFKMRYRPRVTGRYDVRIRGRIGSRGVTFPAFTFVCKENADWKGFVQRMPDNATMLSLSASGEEFRGLGLNVRSPFDTRYRAVFPGTKWEPYNLNMYEGLFKKYKANGINVVEVWMSSWWLGLEWIPDAPGNHGIGHMNQWRAWKLDRLLEWAETYDIYVILAIHNHGKFSMWCDQEWQRNPFNRANGGYLTTPGEFFTSPRAAHDFKRFADYMVARWAHSPRILAWKLFTEVDLTGSQPGEYRGSHVANWHRKMASYIKEKDPNKHLVTTHWSTDVTKAEASPALAGLNELDMLTLDAYYVRRHDTARLLFNLERSLTFQSRMRKPCIITEYGGTPWADAISLIKQQLHFVSWHGFFRGFAVSPMLWWFPLIEEHNLYSEYKALADFSRGETRADATFSHSTVPLAGGRVSATVPKRAPASHEFRRSSGGAVAVSREFPKQLDVYQVSKPRRLLGWVVDQRFLLKNRSLHAQPETHRNVVLQTDGLKAGVYQVTYYDCATGKTTGTSTIRVTSEVLLKLPDFERDVAFKVEPSKN